MNRHDLWQERFQDFRKETGKYLKYIFNGHLLFVMIFAVGGLAFYYSEWVKTLKPDFPVALIMALIIGFVLTSSPVFTFLKEADIVFFLPMETKLKKYFNKSIFISFVFQGYILLMLLAAFMPMHAKVNHASLFDFIVSFLFILVLKYLNLQIKWRILRFLSSRIQFIDSLVRLCLNIACLYLLFSNASFIYPIVLVGVFVFLLYYFNTEAKKKSLKWEKLISLDGKRLSAFYRVANLFTDVPKLKEKIARRKWMDWVLSLIPYQNTSSYNFLYTRTFLRSDDYFGLFIRLTIIGGFAVFAISAIWAKVLALVLFLYLTGLQLLPISRHHDFKIWLELYPLPENLRTRAVLLILNVVLAIQVLIFTVVILLAGNFLAATIGFGAGIIFMSAFYGYSYKKLQSYHTI